jgi:hypothetical protein
MTTTGPFSPLELPPNALIEIDDDGDGDGDGGDADRCGRRRSRARPEDRTLPSVDRADTVNDALVEWQRRSEAERVLELRLSGRRRTEEKAVGVGGVKVDPLAGAEVEALQPPARREAIEEADIDVRR